VFAYVFRRLELVLDGTTKQDMEWHNAFTPATFGHLRVKLSKIKQVRMEVIWRSIHLIRGVSFSYGAITKLKSVSQRLSHTRCSAHSSYLSLAALMLDLGRAPAQSIFADDNLLLPGS
jgi:hypothetical protein